MTTLRVTEIFDSLQGEGYWTGIPMTFVRLAGCNAPELGLGCLSWCDTPGARDPSAGEEMDVAAIVRGIQLPRLCLTGGEPLLQVEGVATLLAEARRSGIRVHVETNGTVGPGTAVPDPGFDWVTVSPKPPAYRVATGWDGLIDELKLVADDSLDTATAERLAAKHPEAVVFVQPQWVQPQRGDQGMEDGGSMARAMALVRDHPEWRLSLQTHKFLGIR